MADNSSEIPENPDSINPQEQNPISGMFDSWNKNSSGPRDIQTEVKQEMQKDSLDIKEPETQEEAVIRLAKSFDVQLKKYSTELIEAVGNNEGWDAQRINEKINETLNSPDWLDVYELRGERDSYNLIHTKVRYLSSQNGDLVEEKIDPELQTIQIEENNNINPDDIQNIRTHTGVVPARFIGSDGNLYGASIGYSLNPTSGEAKKRGSIFRIDELESGLVAENLKKIDYEKEFDKYDEFNGLDYFEDSIEPEDFEKLEEILNRMESGEIKINIDSNVVV